MYSFKNAHHLMYRENFSDWQDILHLCLTCANFPNFVSTIRVFSLFKGCEFKFVLRVLIPCANVPSLFLKLSSPLLDFVAWCLFCFRETSSTQVSSSRRIVFLFGQFPRPTLHILTPLLFSHDIFMY